MLPSMWNLWNLVVHDDFVHCSSWPLKIKISQHRTGAVLSSFRTGIEAAAEPGLRSSFFTSFYNSTSIFRRQTRRGLIRSQVPALAEFWIRFVACDSPGFSFFPWQKDTLSAHHSRSQFSIGKEWNETVQTIKKVRETNWISSWSWIFFRIYTPNSFEPYTPSCGHSISSDLLRSCTHWGNCSGTTKSTAFKAFCVFHWRYKALQKLCGSGRVDGAHAGFEFGDFGKCWSTLCGRTT